MRFVLFVLILLGFGNVATAQYRVAQSKSKINLRDKPDLKGGVLYSLMSTNLLVVWPDLPTKGFVKIYDVDTNTFGYAFESLLVFTDTLQLKPSHHFEDNGKGPSDETEIVLINKTKHVLRIAINDVFYNLDAFEKKYLTVEDVNVRYFLSASGLYPVVGTETLVEGHTYLWKIEL